MKIAILIVSWNGKHFLKDCLTSLQLINFPKSDYQIIVVDNGSDDGSVDYIRLYFPEVILIELKENLGFAGGNNVGLRYILDMPYEFVVLLNQDTVVDTDWLSGLMLAVEQDQTIGAVQSLILKHGHDGIINSSGNQIHIFGFGYCGDLGQPVSSILSRDDRDSHVKDIPYPMGACVLLKIDSLRKIGLFDETFFAYAEDLDLAWRLRLAGYRNIVAPQSIVYHHYEYKRRPQKFAWLERNRWLILLKNYHLGTLIVLFPVLMAFELFMIVYAVRNKWFKIKIMCIREVIYLLPHIWSERQFIQSKRRIPEKAVIPFLTPILNFEEEQSILINLGNIILRIYWQIVEKIVFW